jgi:hypothetical protein
MTDAQTETALATRQDAPLAIAEGPGALLSAMIALAKDPSVRVEVLTTFAAMQERMEDRQAEREFNVAMNACQGEMQPVIRNAENASTHSKFATFDALDAMARPIYIRHGFSLMFGTEAIEGPNVRITLDVAHSGGHTMRKYYDAPPDTMGPKGSAVKTLLHGLGSTDTYLRGRLLRAAFNIVLKNERSDDDGNRAGMRPITQAQADEIVELMKEAGRQESTFLPRMCTDVRSAEEIEEKDFIRVKGALTEIIGARKSKDKPSP